MRNPAGRWRIPGAVPEVQELGFWSCPVSGSTHLKPVNDARAGGITNETCPDCREMVGPTWVYAKAGRGDYEPVS